MNINVSREDYTYDPVTQRITFRVPIPLTDVKPEDNIYLTIEGLPVEAQQQFTAAKLPPP